MKGHVARDAHMQYESPSSSGFLVIATVNVFEK